MNPQTLKKLDRIIALYNSVGLPSRNMNFYGKWLYNVFRESYLPCVDRKYVIRLALDKTKLGIFDVLTDDLADNYKIRNQELLEKAVRIPWNLKKKYQNRYLEVSRKILLDAMNSMESYPRYKEFKEIFYFDLDQFLDSVRYAFLVNTMKIDNTLESKIYSHHNLMVILYCNMDLMCSPNFKKEELKRLRPILHWAQDIIHIGNMLNTYSREIRERDLSSPIVSLGLEEGLIKREDVIKDPESVTENLKSLVPLFRERAESNFHKIKEHANEIESIEINKFYKKLRKAYKSFLSCPYSTRWNNWE